MTVSFLIAVPQGGFYRPGRIRNKLKIKKNLTIFEGCHFSSILYIYFLKFLENQDKEFQLLPMGFPCYELYIFWTVNIGRSQMIAVIRGVSRFSLENVS